MRNAWRFWYQIPMALPVIGPRVIGDPKGRFVRMLGSWVGGGFLLPEDDVAMYLECMRRRAMPSPARGGSRPFRAREMLRWLRGEFADCVDVPVRWLSGTADPVLTPDLIDGYAKHISDFEVETGGRRCHWIVEQRPDLVLDRLRAFLKI